MRITPFSCVASVGMVKQSYDNFDGTISIDVCQNDFTEIVYNSNRRNINTPPCTPLKFTEADFCNLFLPSSYVLHIIGWIHKEDFLNACQQYSGWVWPKDSVNKYHNQPWDQISERDQNMLSKNGFADAIQDTPRLLNAGWLKTTGRGNGACCYVYPNVPRAGGVSETNLYILPSDLYSMASLKG